MGVVYLGMVVLMEIKAMGLKGLNQNMDENVNIHVPWMKT